MSSDSLEGKPLLDETNNKIEAKERSWWRAAHAASYFIGAASFIAGSGLAYYRNNYEDTVWVGIFYLVGSFGFLAFDSLEYFAFKNRRNNIAISIAGSACYVVGSIGFFPYFDDGSSKYDGSDALGVYGYLIGSFFIVISQSWKLWSISNTYGGLLSGVDNNTWALVEIGTAIGGLGYLVGTAIVAAEGWFNEAVTWWLAGSIGFQLGSFVILYRHFGLNLA